MNIEKIKLVLIKQITECSNKDDLIKALDYGVCFVNNNLTPMRRK